MVGSGVVLVLPREAVLRAQAEADLAALEVSRKIIAEIARECNTDLSDNRAAYPASAYQDRLP